MLIIPAIDLKEGRCVRLYKGQFDKELFERDAIEMAMLFKNAGAKRLHIVDLDGAKTGEPKNIETVLKIKEKTNLELEFGGGIRSLSLLEKILSLGIDYVIVGTLFFEKGSRIEDKSRLILSIDIDEEGRVKTHGWQKSSSVKGWEALEMALKLGFKSFIVTFTHKDGTLSGLDFSLLWRFTSYSEASVIFAGGISSLKDIEIARKAGAYGVVIGRALYEEKIPLEVISEC